MITAQVNSQSSEPAQRRRGSFADALTLVATSVTLSEVCCDSPGGPRMRWFRALRVMTVLAALLAPSLLSVQPAWAVDMVNPIPECMIPVSGGSGPGTTWDALFGWEANPRGGPPLEIPAGPPNNYVQGGTLVSGPLPTVFTNPAVRADGSLRHPVWPPQYVGRTGRTQWWPDADVVVRLEWGQTAIWYLDGRRAAEGIGPTTQRCSQHLFLSKTWNGKAEPPANLDFRTYELRVQMQQNPKEPDVVNTGISRCRYQQVVSLPNYPEGMPYGAAFVEPPVRSPTLKCVYQNAGLPFTDDPDGYWIPKGGTYLVSEVGVPPGWYPGRGIGADQVIDYQNPATVARCSFYPGYGTPAATPDSNGEPIPEFGRASEKWCLQPVDNESHPARVSVTKSVEPATATGWAFPFTIHPAPPSGPATLTATAAHPTVTWSGLFPDVTYTITEGNGPAAGYSRGTITCPGGGNSVQPPPAGTAKCVATNTAKRAELSVTKTVRGNGAPAHWAFDFTIHPAPTTGSATATATRAAPTVTFTGLDPGRTYTVTEAAVDGFKQVSLNCGNGGPTVTPGPGEALTCRAVNAVSPTPTAETTSPTPPSAEALASQPTVGPPPPAQNIAATGPAVSILPLAAVGGATVVIGAALTALARRRRSE